MACVAIGITRYTFTNQKVYLMNLSTWTLVWGAIVLFSRWGCNWSVAAHKNGGQTSKMPPWPHILSTFCPLLLVFFIICPLFVHFIHVVRFCPLFVYFISTFLPSFVSPLLLVLFIFCLYFVFLLSLFCLHFVSTRLCPFLSTCLFSATFVHFKFSVYFCSFLCEVFVHFLSTFVLFVHCLPNFHPLLTFCPHFASFVYILSGFFPPFSSLLSMFVGF